MYTVKYSLTSSSSIETQRSYIWQEGFISIFITMSASIIAHYSLTILLKPSSKIGIRGSLIGTITGAIVYGSVAGTSINIGAAIAVGLAAGALSAVYFEKVYPNINGEKIRDTFGLGSIWIVAFLGTFLIAPTVLKTYYNYSVDLPTLYPQNTPPSTYIISNLDVAGWALVYVGVSIAIALLGGLVMGIVLKLLARDNSRNFDDGEYFMLSAYGLRIVTGNVPD
uniref:Predicted protein n=1 Tax=Hordeum vulgare subsp. vulgare TaxID=112509 RepID=F2E105_HORVV|nr:predicted protein [Hordeum vulgare subsp. vulgare]